MRWFRFYSEVLNDPKVQRLPITDRWHWIELLCLANERETRGTLPSISDIAFALRMPAAKATACVETLKAAGLLDLTEAGLQIYGWAKFESGEQPTLRTLWDRMRRFVAPIVLQRDGAVCSGCGATERLTIDHKRPLSRGGDNSLGNLQVLCHSCNSRKGTGIA